MKLDKRTAAAVIAALCFGGSNSYLHGQDGVILQPRYRQQQATERASDANRTARHAEVNERRVRQTLVSTPQAENSERPQSTEGKLGLDPPEIAPAKREAQGLRTGVQAETSASRDRVFSQASFSNSAANQAQQSNGLQWVPSGTLPRDAEGRVNAAGIGKMPSGPIELVNPSYVEQQLQTVAPEPEPTGTTSTIPVSVDSRDPTRFELASRVSQQIIGDDSPRGTQQLRPVALPPGWQAVGQRVSENLANCEALLQRNAFFSAREEAISAVLYLCQVLDQYANTYQCEPAWHAAMQALNEAEDFAGTQRLTTDESLLYRIVQSHETPVLKASNTSQVSPLAAAAHYRSFAEQELVKAAQGHPWLGELYYSVGRTLQAQADSVGGLEGTALRYRAITFYRASSSVDPSNPLAANQLGFVLLQMDQPADARDALLRSLESSASLDAIQNLVEASRRLGDTQLNRWAMENYARLRSQTQVGPQIPNVIEVDQHTFAQMSTRAAGPKGINRTQVANLPNQANYPTGPLPVSQSPAGYNRY